MSFEIQNMSRVVICSYIRPFLYRQLFSINKSFSYEKRVTIQSYTKLTHSNYPQLRRNENKLQMYEPVYQFPFNLCNLSLSL